MSEAVNVLYLVHDLGDAAIRRRVRFLRDGGATVVPIGFVRVQAAKSVAASEGRAIGVTQDGRLVRRVLTTLRAALFTRSWRGQMREADVVLARSLEMLMVAVVVRARSGLATPIVYECLDIHRLMTGRGPSSWTLRRIEQRLLDACGLLIVSSPRFIEAYFERMHRRLPPWILLENKVLASELGSDATMRKAKSGRPDGPPWRIGWFGIIRCRRSLALLAALVTRAGGAVEVEIRGRPARDVIPEFDSVVEATPGLRFGGSYDRATDLPDLYGGVHFSWAIDFYEEGLNSAWLLPNRLYEGSMFGTVPLALDTVETGNWLAAHECGVLLRAPLEESLERFFARLDTASYDALQRSVAGLDPMALMETAESARRFVGRLDRLSHPVAMTAPLAANSHQDEAA